MSLNEHQKALRRKYNKTEKGRASRTAYKQRMREERPARYKRMCMLQAAQARVRKGKAAACTITMDDIQEPSQCPALGIELCWDGSKVTDNSPTLDKVIPELGYVPGNVQVISHKANNIKHNATADEIESVAHWLRNLCTR